MVFVANIMIFKNIFNGDNRQLASTITGAFFFMCFRKSFGPYFCKINKNEIQN